MSFFNLKLTQKSEDLIVFTIPLYTRLIMGFFSLIISYTFVIDPGFYLIPVLLLAILLLTTFYKESWVFDRKNQKVIYGFGLLFLYKKTVVSFDSIENFRLEGFVKGSLTAKPVLDDENPLSKKTIFRSDFWKLTLNNSTYGELTIHTVKGKQRERLRESSRQIARFCNAELIEK